MKAVALHPQLTRVVAMAARVAVVVEVTTSKVGPGWGCNGVEGLRLLLLLDKRSVVWAAV